MPPPYDLVLFDLDGTLSDPIQGIGKSINYALASFGYVEVSLSQVASYVGPPLDEAFAAVIGSSEVRLIDALVAKYPQL